MIHRPTRSSPSPAARPRRAFTFIEVLVVTVILAILAVVAMPNILSATTPMPEPVGEAIEADLRRARIESISRLEPMVVVVGAAVDVVVVNVVVDGCAFSATPHAVMANAKRRLVM